MVRSADRIEFVVTETEVEALVLEISLIQSFQPRFNVRLKDDKSYPWLAITLSSEWPRPMVTRGVRRRGTRYFGPFGHPGALRKSVDLLLPIFPVRTCSDAKMARHQRSGRPCLLFDLNRCSGPCIGAVDRATYDNHLEGFLRFFSGEASPIIDDLSRQMSEAAHAQDYERAARLRDGVTALREAAESQQLVLGDRDQLDVIGIAADDLQVAAMALHVRHGRIVGQSTSVADLVEELDQQNLLATVIRDIYGDPAAEIPPVIMTAELPQDHEILTSWLTERSGTPVALRIAQRGQKRSLVTMAERNAAEELSRDRMRRASDHNVRSQALVEIQGALGLSRPPFRIECYDMSHLQGTSYVGSMVVFEDGLPAKSAYRHFSVKTVPGNDDYAAMDEVLRRRLRRWNEQSEAENAPIRRGFAAPADLLLIDGGPGQLGVVVRALDEFGLTDEVEVASLAKRFEEVYLPGRSEPVRLPRGSEGLFLLQRIRDEAHRFAITFHRSTRGKAMTRSVLEEIPGLGDRRRERLLAEFGTLDAIRELTVADLDRQSWLPHEVAVAIFDRLHPTRSVATSAVDDFGADSSYG